MSFLPGDQAINGRVLVATSIRACRWIHPPDEGLAIVLDGLEPSDRRCRLRESRTRIDMQTRNDDSNAHREMVGTWCHVYTTLAMP